MAKNEAAEIRRYFQQKKAEADCILPESLEKMKSLIFWGIIAAGAGGGGFLCGKFLNRR